jgi:hypothetical protein
MEVSDLTTSLRFQVEQVNQELTNELRTIEMEELKDKAEEYTRWNSQGQTLNQVYLSNAQIESATPQLQDLDGDRYFQPLMTGRESEIIGKIITKWITLKKSVTAIQLLSAEFQLEDKYLIEDGDRSYTIKDLDLKNCETQNGL